MRRQALRLGGAGWAAFEAALRAADLPTDDLRADDQRFFAFEDGAAFGGYTLAGPVALLRSLVVAPDRRRQGVGARALAALLDAARRDGAEEAWLLTTAAAGFFARHGFAAADRAAAPPAVAASRQSESLCPASAVLMCRKPA